jgi:hypothetical protein
MIQTSMNYVIRNSGKLLTLTHSTKYQHSFVASPKENLNSGRLFYIYQHLGYIKPTRQQNYKIIFIN